MFNAISFRNKLAISIAVLMALVLLAVAVMSFSAIIPAKAAADNQPTKRTINVTGTGTIKATPDIAYVTIGVVTENKDAKIAQQDNAKAMDKVVASIKALGIKSEDIKTVNYSISPKYDYNKDTGESSIVGYTVNNSAQVTVRDITKAGSIIDLGADSGVNITSNISFGISDYDKYYSEALKKALDSAKIKAETMAGAFKIKLGTPVTINENGGYNPTPIYNRYEVKSDAAMASTPIQAGTMEISANVSLVYEY